MVQIIIWKSYKKAKERKTIPKNTGNLMNKEDLKSGEHLKNKGDIKNDDTLKYVCIQPQKYSKP